MIHVWTRSTFNYLFNLNQKRIACHESYTDLYSITLGYGTLDRSPLFRHHHFCLVIAHSLDLVFKENLRQ